MKTNKLLITGLIALLFVLTTSITATSQEKIDNAEIKITTHFHCGNGKALIEKELAKVKGVSEAVADIETKVVTIKYDTSLLNKEKLVAAIEKIGYTTEFSAKDVKINKACSHDVKDGDKPHKHKEGEHKHE